VDRRTADRQGPPRERPGRRGLRESGRAGDLVVLYLCRERDTLKKFNYVQ
jgi:hypothetical protein